MNTKTQMLELLEHPLKGLDSQSEMLGVAQGHLNRFRQDNLGQNNINALTEIVNEIRTTKDYEKLRQNYLKQIILNDKEKILNYLRSGSTGKLKLLDVDLTNADYNRANLKGANLSGANLTKANLTYADLSGADLTKRTLLEQTLLEQTLQVLKLIMQN